MIITSENISKVREMFGLIEVLNKDISELVKQAKLNSDNIIKVTRRDGKSVEMSEKQAWEEIRLLNKGTEAYNFMATKYPEPFEKSKILSEKTKELEEYTMKNFNISHNKVSLIEIIDVATAIFEMKELEKKAKK